MLLATMFFAAFRTFSNARTSICRIRSRDTLYCSRKLLERERFVRQMPRLENATFAVVQYIDGGDQCLMLVVFLVLRDNDGLGEGD